MKTELRKGRGSSRTVNQSRAGVERRGGADSVVSHLGAL